MFVVGSTSDECFGVGLLKVKLILIKINFTFSKPTPFGIAFVVGSTSDECFGVGLLKIKLIN